MNSPYTFRVEHEIRWRDLDALDHINNATYFTYFEEARIRFMNEMGHGDVITTTDVGPILAHIHCDFLSPVTYPDQLSIGCGVSKIGNTSFQISHDIFSHTQQQIVAKATSVVVMVNYMKKQPVAIPQGLRVALEKYVTPEDQ